MSKTVEDLVSLFYHKLNGPDDATAEDAMRVVVTALRDEMPFTNDNCGVCSSNRRTLNEILAAREDGQAAGTVTAMPEAIERTTPAAPAPVCVWTKQPKFGFTISCTDKWLMNSNYGGDTCPECGGLIEYKRPEAQR